MADFDKTELDEEVLWAAVNLSQAEGRPVSEWEVDAALSIRISRSYLNKILRRLVELNELQRFKTKSGKRGSSWWEYWYYPSPHNERAKRRLWAWKEGDPESIEKEFSNLDSALDFFGEFEEV